MSKLHEILAVESTLTQEIKELLGKVSHIFSEPQKFTKYIKTLTNFEEDAAQTAAEETGMAVETLVLLQGFTAHYSRYLDTILKKETTNYSAKADIIINETTIAKDVPVTFLLGLETKFKTIFDLYKKLPVLDATILWEVDHNTGKNIHRTKNPIERLKTAKRFKSQILSI